MSIINSPEDFKKILCNISLVVHGQTREFQLEEDLNINWDEIEHDLDNFPQIYHLWAMIYSEAKEYVNMLDKKIRRRKGKLTGEILANEGKGLRRGDIADMIECDDDLLKVEAEHIRAQKITGKLYFTLESLKMKNDNMRSLFGMKKQEMRS